ncbi:AAA family ATPase [Phaeobacter sp. JH20_32]|uniref:AAA family ATPase n=1 Tax=Phaeobacter sp. JH20_32 TaxID=3112489 RepID=UPI003A8403C9
MQVLSLIAQKGGVGKTTLATCLAVQAVQQGKQVLVIDLDPQATASFWSDTRGKPDDPAVMSIQPVRLPAVLKAASDAGTDMVIIDGAAVSKEVAYSAAEVSDLVLVPFKAAVFDINSVAQTVQTIKQVGSRYALVLTFVPPQGKETEEAKDIATQLGSNFCPVLIGNRKAFFRAQSSGLAVQEFEPDGKAAEEIKALYTYVSDELAKQPQEAGNVKKFA